MTDPASAGIQAGGQLVNGLLGLASSKLQQKYNKQNMAQQQAYNESNMATQQAYNEKNMRLQQQYWNEQFGAQNEREDYLNANQYLIQKQAMKAAGYSTADPMSGGTALGANSLASPSSVSSANPSAQGIGLPSVAPPELGNFGNLAMELADIGLKRSQKRNQDIKNQFEEERQKRELESISLSNDNLQKLQEVYDAQISETYSRRDLNNSQKKQIAESIFKLQAETESIKINNKYLDDLNVEKINEIKAHIRNLETSSNKQVSEKQYQDIVNKFARIGLFVGNDFLSNLQFLATSGHGKEIVQSTISTLKQFVTELMSQGEQPSKDAIEAMESFWDDFDHWIANSKLVKGHFDMDQNDDNYLELDGYDGIFVDRSGNVFMKGDKGGYHKIKGKTLSDFPKK